MMEYIFIFVSSKRVVKMLFGTYSFSNIANRKCLLLSEKLLSMARYVDLSVIHCRTISELVTNANRVAVPPAPT